jgi:putative ABC transport system permease protein
MLDNFPEVENFTRVRDVSGYASTKDNEKFEINYLMADFGKIPGIGEVIKIDNYVEYKISGIMEDMPENTHFRKVDAIVHFPTHVKKYWGSSIITDYGNNSFGLYLLEKQNTDLSEKLPEILSLFKDGLVKEAYLEPLTEAYFSPTLTPWSKNNSEIFVKILSGIVVLILLLSVFNYVNLTTAISTFRSKEIAIKKILGGNRFMFTLQYISESIALCIISFLVALLFSFVAEPLFNNLMNTRLELSDALTPGMIVGYIIAVIVVGVVSGIIPALKISNFNAVEIVKGSFWVKEKSLYSRILVSFQYFIIITLIISSIFVSRQTNFMRNFNLGFEKENIISIRNTIHGNQSGAFKSILEKIPGIDHVCFVEGSPLDGGNNNTMQYDGRQISFQTFGVDTSYFNMMGIEVRHTGAALSDDAIWINETGAREMGLAENATSVKIYGLERQLYGIVKDFHFKDLKQKIGPAYFYKKDMDASGGSILVKISGKNKVATIDRIREEYHEFTNGLPLKMEFMDDTINTWYEKEEKAGKIVWYFTFLTVIISVMGLFAMSLYYVQHKIKEIGIRKVNGARVSEILEMLNREFLIWVIIAFTFSAPLAYYIVNRWLENFPYKIELNWLIFALAGLLAMVIAIITISWQSYKAATRNPVEALRYE